MLSHREQNRSEPARERPATRQDSPRVGPPHRRPRGATRCCIRHAPSSLETSILNAPRTSATPSNCAIASARGPRAFQVGTGILVPFWRERCARLHRLTRRASGGLFPWSGQNVASGLYIRRVTLEHVCLPWGDAGQVRSSAPPAQSCYRRVNGAHIACKRRLDAALAANLGARALRACRL
jgi:hypothetical protein